MEEFNSAHSNSRKQFGATAKAYVTSPGHASGEDLNLLIEAAGEVSGRKALDVATGGGHTALALARSGAQVTATDLTPEMLEAAKSFAAEQGVHMEFREAAAEALPFDDHSFDIVSCRIAPHHFASPARFIQEVARVLKPAGKFLMIDNIVPEDRAIAGIVNHIEKTRDSSHVEAYTAAFWIGLMAEEGLDLEFFARWRRTKNYTTWASRSGMSTDAQVELADWIHNLDNQAIKYLRAEFGDGQLIRLDHEAALFASSKPG